MGNEFAINGLVSDNDDVMDIIQGLEDKVLERGSLTDLIGVSSFDFSIHVCSSNDKNYLAIDILSDQPDFSAADLDWDGVFGYVIGELEDRGFFGEVSEVLDGEALETDRVICLSGGTFIKFSDYI